MQNDGLPGEVVGPVHDVEPEEGGGEHDSAEDVDLLGSGLVFGRPACKH